MKTLFVKQTHKNGTQRTWRLRPHSGFTTLGSSRLAKLSSVDGALGGIAGGFECKEEQWTWIPLSRDVELQPVRIKEGSVIEIGDSKLSFDFAERDQEFMKKVIDSASSAKGEHEYQLEVVSWNGQLLASRLIVPGKKTPELDFGPATQIHKKSIRLTSDKGLRQLKLNKTDKSTRQGALLVSGFGVLFLLAALLGPKGQHQVVAALPPLPPRMNVTIAEFKKPEAKKAEKIEPASTQPAASGGGAKVSGALSALRTGRISKLLGKVSAHAAKSKEVIVTQGIRAGEGSSARALSALGKVDSGQGDWAQSGKGINVGTVGNGSGRGLAGVAGLGAGRTGSGNIGLVEDESEISGGLDREVIANVIKSQLGQILYCYERQLSASPDLFGKVAVKFTIGPNGTVEAQKIGDSTLKNATVESCILTRVAGWKFPTPKGGTRVQVSYPFLFKSTN